MRWGLRAGGCVGCYPPVPQTCTLSYPQPHPQPFCQMWRCARKRASCSAVPVSGSHRMHALPACAHHIACTDAELEPAVWWLEWGRVCRALNHGRRALAAPALGQSYRDAGCDPEQGECVCCHPRPSAAGAQTGPGRARRGPRGGRAPVSGRSRSSSAVSRNRGASPPSRISHSYATRTSGFL